MLRVLSAVAVVAVLSGCANQSFTESGFLESYEHEVVEGFDDMVATVDHASLARYQRVVIAEPEWRLAEDVEVDEEKQVELSQHLRESLIREISQCLTVTDTLAPGVLTLKTAITDIDGVSRGLNLFTSIVFFGPVDNGGASVEFTLEDTSTELQLASGVGFEAGGIKEVTKSFSQYGHAKFAFDEVAKGIKASLEPAEPAEPVAAR
ncbi:MAG: DUF3313 family protein [Pseudomonadota bacterium]